MYEYKLYFATNRKHVGDQWSPSSYGKEFSEDGRENLRFGKVTVQADYTEVKKYLNEKIDRLGKGNGEALASYFAEQVEKASQITAYKESIKSDVPETNQSRTVFGSNQFFNDLKSEMMNCTDTLVYIHGYNVDWNHAVGSALALQEMLNNATYGNTPQPVLVVLFTWPSDGSMFPFRAYFSDRKDAKDSGYAVGRAILKLRDFFIELREDVRINNTKMCKQEIHLLSHSMGNYVLQNAVKRIEEFVFTPALPKLLEHIFLCAADVDDNILEPGQQLSRLNELCRSVSVYYNRGDKALMFSDATKGNPERLGSNGAAHPHMLHNKICQIDCSDVVKDLAGHSYYLNGSINGDIKQSIEGFAQDDKRRDRITTNELPNIWKMTNIKTREKMAKTCEEIQDCVRAKVRAFCFEGAQITDDEIGQTKMSELNLTQDSHMPGVSPADALAKSLCKCACMEVELSGDELVNNHDWTVDDVADKIYAQTV
jgi:esterase/lipase superfamily enzyme